MRNIIFRECVEKKKMQTHTHIIFHGENLRKSNKEQIVLFYSQEKSIWFISEVLVKHNDRLERSVVRVRLLLF